MIYRRLFNVPTWQFRSPFGDLERMRQQMDRLFEEAWAPYKEAQAGVFPLTNLSEDKENYYVRAELPGVKGDQLDIQFTLGELVNQENIDAKLNDGVLRLSLPKVEKATPKKIAVKTG